MNKLYYNSPLLAVLLMIVGGLFVLFLIGTWYNSYDRKQKLPTIQALTQEIEDLELSLQDVVNRTRNQDLEIEMRDQLLEEKNIELAFMTDKLNKMAELQAAKKKELESLKEQLLASRSMLREAYKALDEERENMGLIYRVQIGMLEGETIPAFPFDPQMFLVEEVENYNKYVLGSFREYPASLEFRDLIRKLGVKDAWVVAYRDGNRVELTELREMSEFAEAAM